MKKIIRFIMRLIVSKKVLFADLDGTLIVTKSGKTFPVDKDDWKFKDGIIPALQEYNPNYLFIVSNQGGIEKGFISEKDWLDKIRTIEKELYRRLTSTHIEFNYEISNDKYNPRRKPNCGMLEEFYHDYINGNDFNKKDALMIGDASGLKGQFSDSDYQCAKNFGIKYLDVDYFIHWSHPCDYCRDSQCDCKFEFYETEGMHIPCYMEYNIKDWIKVFETLHYDHNK